MELTINQTFRKSSVCLIKGRQFYQLYYYDENNLLRQRSLKTKTEKEAYEKADEWLDHKNFEYAVHIETMRMQKHQNSMAIADTKQIGNFDVSIPVSLMDAYKDYLDVKKKECGTRHYDALKGFIKDIKDLDWGDLDPRAFKRFRSNLYSIHSTTTVSSKCVLLQCFLSHCVRIGYIPDELRKRLNAQMPRKGKASTPSNKYIPKEVRDYTFSYFKDNDYDMYLFLKTMYYTVSRSQEIASLKPRDINQQFGYITISMPKTRHVKVIEEAKVLIDELTGYIDSRNDEYIFASQNTRYYSDKWNKIMDELGLRHRRNNGKIANDFDIRHLRHTAITEIIRNTDEHTAQRFAGHSKVKTTRGYYQKTASLTEGKHIA